MKQLLLLLAVVVTFSCTAVAQTDGSGARTPDTREDLSTWSTAAKHPTQKERKADVQGGSEAALMGCLAAGQEDGKFTLTTAHDKRAEVTPNAGIDLKAHVGQQVRLTGKWENSEVARNKETAQRKPGHRNFKAVKVDRIAAECKAPAGAKQKERAGR